MTEGTSKFIQYMYENKIHKRSFYYWSRERRQVEKVMLSYFVDISREEAIDIFSDPYWIRYPTRKTEFNYRDIPDEFDPVDLKFYGPALKILSYKMAECLPKLFDLFCEYSEGLFLCYAMDYSAGKRRIEAAQRAKESRDNRARLRAAKILPLKDLYVFYKDSNTTIRKAVIKRIGIDNCFELFLHDKDIWIKRVSDLCAAPNVEEYKEFLEEAIDNPQFRANYLNRVLLRELLTNMEKEELLYYLELSGNDSDIDDILDYRMESKWG